MYANHTDNATQRMGCTAERTGEEVRRWREATSPPLRFALFPGSAVFQPFVPPDRQPRPSALARFLDRSPFPHSDHDLPIVVRGRQIGGH